MTPEPNAPESRPVSLATARPLSSWRLAESVPATVPPLSVWLIEAQPLARSSLGVLLAQGPYRLQVVGLAASCTAALETLATPPATRPDVFLLSWPLAAPEGLPHALHLMRQYPEAKALVLADNAAEAGADADLVQLMAGGAVGCLPKQIDPCALPAILHSLYQGALILPLTPPLASYRRTGAQPVQTHFTRRELDILLGVGQGQPNNQIARRLGLSPATVRTHVSRLLGKLGLTNRTQLALYAQRHPRTA